MTGKRDAHERLGELIAAAVRGFTPEGYRPARLTAPPPPTGLSRPGIRRAVLAALPEYLNGRAEAGTLRRTPDAAATARLVLETLTWFARHRFSDPDGAAIPADLAADTAVDALVHALVPAGA